MAHLYKMSEWECSGRWYVNDIEDLTFTSSKWWMAMRVLEQTPVEYVQTLLSYKAQHISYYEPTDVLTFSFNSQADARKFKNYINKIAREKKFMC